MSKGYNIHVSYTKYPGNEHYYVICDVCGCKLRKRDAIQIQDRFNLQNKLLVCKRDADKENQQARPFKAREYKAPRLVRPDTDHLQLDNNPTRLPSAPLQLQAFINPIANSILLTWLGPDSGGSSEITGYVIYQANPQLTTSVVINANTQNASPTYNDLVSDINGSYTYQVAAINSAGIGPKSLVAFYPTIQASLTALYLCAGNGNVLSAGNGTLLLAGGSI
jgi:hypothetical protein